MRLIDADKLNLLLGISEKDIYAKWMLDKMPTIDAVTVVRCRECKLWLNSQLFPHSFYCLRTERVAYPDDFCSYGERKEGAD